MQQIINKNRPYQHLDAFLNFLKFLIFGVASIIFWYLVLTPLTANSAEGHVFDKNEITE